MRARSGRLGVALGVLGAAVALAPLSAGSATAGGERQPLTAAGAAWSLAALAEHGVQQVPKTRPTQAQVDGTAPLPGANPYLTEGPDEGVDIAFWDELVERRSAQRAAAAEAASLAAPSVPVVDELEPPDVRGTNDELALGQPLPGIGTGAGEDRDVRIAGALALPGVTVRDVGPFAEDDGAIPLASDATLTGSGQRVRVSGAIGDGPHGRSGSGTGDFDVFAVRGATAGQVLTVDVDAFAFPSALLDSFVAVADAGGAILAVNDDEATGPDSFLQLPLPADGDYYVALTAFGSLPTNPFDSASGTGARSEGPYAVELSLDVDEDVDVYRVDLAAGDVVSATVSGGGHVLGLFDPAGEQVVGSAQDFSATYPAETPLLGGGNAVIDHVAGEAGPHALVVARGAGAYEARVRLLRPALESAAPGSQQVVYLDFDGAELNTVIYVPTLGGNPGVRQLSPMSAFIGGCQIAPEQVDGVIDRVVARVTENLTDAGAANPAFGVEVRNSRDHADPFGQPGVSRVIIGGSRAEMGDPAATFQGIAQSIDPGNMDPEETVVVLMDHICAPSGTVPLSGNDVLGPDSDRVTGVGDILGFVASHEVGHISGDWHTDSGNGVASIMDRFDLTQLGFGPDGRIGTIDDVDVDFVEDAFEEAERFVGQEHTGDRIAFGLTAAAADLPAAPDAVTAVAIGRGARVTWTGPTADPGDVTGFVVRAVRAGVVVEERTVAARVDRVRFRTLPGGTYVFTVAAIGPGGEGAATTSAELVVRDPR